MAAPRKPQVRAAELVQVAEQYLRGVPQATIAAALGIDQSTVSRDLKALQEQWAAHATALLDTHKAAELARIDGLERTYWEAWAASKTYKRETQAGARGPDGKAQPTRASVTSEARPGNPAFLAGVERCIALRCKLLGLNAPEKHEQLGDLRIMVEYADSDPYPAPFAPGASLDEAGGAAL